MTGPKNGPIRQIGYIVEDLDASIRRWIDTAGLGPWTVFRNVSMNGTYRSQPTTVTMNVGLAYQNDVQIELIQPTNDARSPYRAANGDLILGAHHIAWLTDNLENAVAQAEADGLKTVFHAENPGTRVAYLEMESEPGVRFEFIESASTAQLIEAGIAASRNWDGSNPVQVIDFAKMS